jgi:hypothetical protein
MEISKGNLVVIRAENEPGHEKALPIAYCFGLLKTASVRLAVEKATKQLEGSYNKWLKGKYAWLNWWRLRYGRIY